MIKNSLDNMQHDNKLFDDDVQLEALAAPLSPFEIELKPDLVTLDPSFEANNHDFQHNLTFSIDLFCFQSHPLSNKKVASPQLICAEIHYWTLSTKLPLNMMHMHTVRPFSSMASSLASTENTTAIHNKIVGADDNQLGPHPTIYDESSSSSLYPMLSCPDLFPMICCRLLHHSSLNLRLISTL